MAILFRTATSALHTHPLDDEWVQRMPTIAEEVDPLLIHHPPLIIYGRQCRMQRDVGFFSDESVGYQYSGQLARSQPLSQSLRDLLTYINHRFGAGYNGILVNKYSSGADYISKHSDDESALDETNGVMMISVGAVRCFRIRQKSNNAIVVDVPTEPDVILNMTGDFQKEFTHEVPVQKSVDGVRYSFTFRRHLQ